MKLHPEQIYACREVLYSMYGSITYRLTDADIEVIANEIKALVETKLVEPPKGLKEHGKDNK